MSKLKKRSLIVVGVLGIIIIATIAIIFASLNGLVKSAVERAGTESLKVPVTLTSADVSPFSGSAGLNALTIGSPEGFKSPSVFSVGQVRVTSPISQLLSAPVRVVSINIDKPEIVVEQANGKFNVMVLKDNLGTNADKPPTEPDKPAGESMKLIISSLDITDARVSLRPGVPGLKESYDVTIPTISLKNIGTADGNQNGEELGRIVSDVLNAIAARAVESDQVPEEVRRVLRFDIDKAIDRVKDKASIEAKKATDKLESEAKKGLDKLLGGNKNKESTDKNSGK